LAVLQIKSSPSDLKPATFGNSTVIRVGDPVMAIGNPLGLSDTVTTGIISALNRPVTTSQSPGGSNDLFGARAVAGQVGVGGDKRHPDRAAINPGNSGGALVDAQGRVIGVTSSIALLSASSSSRSGSIGLGFAIPSNETPDVANQLVQTGSVKHALLGVTLKDGVVAVGGAQRHAAVAVTVASGGAAASGGVTAGDNIIALNHTTIEARTPSSHRAARCSPTPRSC
jgi:putative serine protease PepD